MAENDYVRRRLTHSLEVSCVGRSLGARVGAAVTESDAALREYSVHDFGDVVAAASAAHDIGNPPFGHSGEEAIRSWFAEKGEPFLKGLDDQERSDLLRFEGNAQGFRILSRLQYPQNPGLQLTCAVFGAIAKYPRPSHLPKGGGASEKKFGYLKADESAFREMAETLELPVRAGGGWARHPLAFLVEAADDICYHVIDLEDGYRNGRVRFDEVLERLGPIALAYRNGQETSTYKRIADDDNRVEYLRAISIGNLIEAVVQAFMENLQPLLSGAFERSLVSASAFASNVEGIGEFNRRQIYSAPRVLQIEAAGFEVIWGLLDRFVPAIAGAQLAKKDEKLRQLVPPQFLTEDSSSYERLLMVTDFIAGMTDTFAIRMFRRVSGVEIPGS